MLAPAAPHITEELWSRRLAAAGRAVGVDPRRRRGRRSTRAAVVESTREIPVQVNGKLRDKVVVADRRHDRRDRGGGPGARPDPGDPRRPRAGPDRRGRRRQARQPRRPVTVARRRARLRPPSRRDRAGRRGHRSGARGVTVLAAIPDAVETFDAGRRPARDRDGPVDARLPVRDHPAQGARSTSSSRTARPPEPGRPDRGDRQADPPRQGPLGRGPGPVPAVEISVDTRRQE